MAYSLPMDRAMIAGIRQLGRCSCPKDLAKKSHLDLLGTARSRKIISQTRRTDNQAHRALVQSARALIYENGLGVRAKDVERKLSKTSLVPTLVS